MILMRISPPSTLIRRIAHGGCALACALALLAGEKAVAQSAVTGVPNAMQGFSQNRDQPIQIEAATLEMRDKKKEATFSGNVKAVQGDTTMTSKILVVFYESNSNSSRTPRPRPQPIPRPTAKRRRCSPRPLVPRAPRR